ncbi:hypothetical protein P20480_2932 [Pseudoalteromonas sp. BSi20480]|nr:hypothetical protein P20480_2932 [Pseudoalteromonas sp. BSi20480]
MGMAIKYFRRLTSRSDETKAVGSVPLRFILLLTILFRFSGY